VSGWAVENHRFEPSKMSKMAVPGRGDIDLSTFGLVMGKVKEFDLKKNMDGDLFSKDKADEAKPADAKKP
jgi:hypothetical protein